MARDHGGPHIVFDEISVGDQVTPLVRGPLTPVHLMRWSAATENWHRIHYDEPFARDHDGLPTLLVNGSWKQHFLVQMVSRWLGPTGWLAEIAFEFRRMDPVGVTLTAWGTVTAAYERDGLGFVQCDIGIRDAHGTESTPGVATGVLPLQPDERVPYPFPADAAG